MKLEEYLSTVPAFDWAEANCCHFISRWFAAHGHPYPMDGLEKTPDCRSAHRLALALGGIEEAVSRGLRRQSKPPQFAQVGDIVLFPVDGGFTLGICNGWQAACVSEDGIGWLPMSEAICAWRLRP